MALLEDVMAKPSLSDFLKSEGVELKVAVKAPAAAPWVVKPKKQCWLRQAENEAVEKAYIVLLTHKFDREDLCVCNLFKTGL